MHQLVSSDNTKLKRTSVQWTEECEESFCKLKELCSNTPVLAYPDYTKNFKLYTDASESGLGAVITQVQEDRKERPIAYVAGLYPSRSAIMMLISWNSWPSIGRLPTDFMSTCMEALSMCIQTTIC